MGSSSTSSGNGHGSTSGGSSSGNGHGVNGDGVPGTRQGGRARSVSEAGAAGGDEGTAGQQEVGMQQEGQAAAAGGGARRRAAEGVGGEDEEQGASWLVRAMRGLGSALCRMRYGLSDMMQHTHH